jgi:hypothetical protein
MVFKQAFLEMARLYRVTAPSPIKPGRNKKNEVPVSVVDINMHVESVMNSHDLVCYISERLFIPLLIVTISHIGLQKVKTWNSMRSYLDTASSSVVVERDAVGKKSFDNIILPILCEFIADTRRSTLPQIDGGAPAPLVVSDQEDYFSKMTDIKVFGELLTQQCLSEIRQAITFVGNQQLSLSKDTEGCTISDASWVVAARHKATTYFAATLLHSIIRDQRTLALEGLAAATTNQHILFLQSSLLLLLGLNYSREEFLQLSTEEKAELNMGKVVDLDQKGVLVYPHRLWIQFVILMDSLVSSICLARKQMGCTRYDITECVVSLEGNSTVIAMLDSLVRVADDKSLSEPTGTARSAASGPSSGPAAAKHPRLSVGPSALLLGGPRTFETHTLEGGALDGAGEIDAEVMRGADGVASISGASSASAASIAAATSTSKAASLVVAKSITGTSSFFDVPASAKFPLPSMSKITNVQWKAYLTGPLQNCRKRAPNSDLPHCDWPLLRRLLVLFADYKRADLERTYNVQRAVDSSDKTALRASLGKGMTDSKASSSSSKKTGEQMEDDE